MSQVTLVKKIKIFPGHMEIVQYFCYYATKFDFYPQDLGSRVSKEVRYMFQYRQSRRSVFIVFKISFYCV